jgi:hypothetical protein
LRPLTAAFVLAFEVGETEAARSGPNVRTPPTKGPAALTALHATILALLFSSAAAAQELQPRAYLPAPVGLNFFGIGYSRNSGGLLFDPSLPITDAHIDADVLSLSFGQSFGLFGRSAQALAVIPYARADITGRLSGVEAYRYRSGLTDSLFRFAMNIAGAPAMSREAFAKHRPRTTFGASLTVLAPTGQYDPNVLLNIGTNRWAFKPEVGLSKSFGRWAVEGAVGAWFYSGNAQFGGASMRTQDPLASIQLHAVRVLSRRMWVAVNGTYFTGGRTHINGAEKADYQGNSRIGTTFGVALKRRHAFKIAYFEGATTRFGSDIRSISMAYQVIWMAGRAK